MSFVSGLWLPDLGLGASFTVWAFRATAVGKCQCCTLRNGFDETFGHAGPIALDAMLDFVYILGGSGGRRISLSQPGCCRVTADELSIVALLAAVQDDDKERCRAHLSWLMCGVSEPEANKAAFRVGSIFQQAKMLIQAPAVEVSPPKKNGACPVLHQVGHA